MAERHAIDKLHHDEVAVVCGVDVVDGDDVRVVQRRRRARFLGEAALSLRASWTGLQDFDRDFAPKAFVLRLVDDAHTAVSKFATDDVTGGQAQWHAAAGSRESYRSSETGENVFRGSALHAYGLVEDLGFRLWASGFSLSWSLKSDLPWLMASGWTHL